MPRRPDFAPALMISCAVLTLSGATLLAPHPAAQASPPKAPQPPIMGGQNKSAAYDDGDGDELLEHWGDPKYSGEEQEQMAGVLGGFLLLSGLAWRKRARRCRKAQPVALTLVDVSEQRKAA